VLFAGGLNGWGWRTSRRRAGSLSRYRPLRRALLRRPLASRESAADPIVRSLDLDHRWIQHTMQHTANTQRSRHTGQDTGILSVFYCGANAANN